MAEGSRYASYFVKEASSGVTPTPAVFDVFRATKSGLDLTITALQSEEIRNDAEVADFRLGTRHVEGTATGELSYGTFDPLIAGALRGVWQADSVVGGILRQSFTFIDYNADVTDLPYTVYRGCEINTMAINISAAAMTTIEFGVIGRSMEQLKTLPAGWTINPRSATAPMDGFSGSLQSNGQILNVITEMAINIDNGIEPRFVVGSKFSIKPGSKRRNVTGTMTAYFEDNSLRLAFLNELEQSIVLAISDGNAGNTYEITMPRTKLTEAPRPIDGEGDIMQNMAYRGLLDAATGNSIKIVRKVVVPAPTGAIVTPASVPVVAKGATQQFKGTALGTSAQAGTWKVTPTAAGTINASGLFTADAAAPAGPATIEFSPTADPTIKATATIESFREADVVAPDPLAFDINGDLPATLNKVVGDSFTLGPVEVIGGTPPYTYDWYKNGVHSGLSTSTVSIRWDNATAEDDNHYVVISDSDGQSIESTHCQVTIA